MAILKRIRDWLYDRLGLERVSEFVLHHPVPEGNVTRRIGWAYVLGVATMTAFLLQVVTGIALASKYIPSAAHAYESLIFINREVWFGWFIRGMHYFGASAMIVLISLHMARVFLTGSYKYPREMNWVLGVVLLLLTVLMAATGQLLRWDQNGIWTVTVGSQLLGRVPYIGQALAQFILAGDQVGGATLTRFFAFHVLILPGLIFLTAGLHIYLVLHHGISEPPTPGKPVDAKTYREEYRRELERSPYRYWPDAAWREAVAGVGVVVVIVALAAIFGPKGPHDPPDPTTIAADPRPDWYFRWYYALLAVKPRGLETFTMVYLPALIGLGLLILPFVANQGERSPSRRPWAVGLVGLVIIVIAVLTELGMRAPWAMDFETRPIPAETVGFTEGPVWEGSVVFYERGCQFCHTVAGHGGDYGPDLTRILRRIPPEVFVTRTVQGFGDMPGYRDTISPAELSAILTFLQSMGERH
jgi:ubiquinol-cytochrome c reductase cytochrome b subunit